MIAGTVMLSDLTSAWGLALSNLDPRTIPSNCKQCGSPKPTKRRQCRCCSTECTALYNKTNLPVPQSKLDSESDDPDFHFVDGKLIIGRQHEST